MSQLLVFSGPLDREKGFEILQTLVSGGFKREDGKLYPKLLTPDFLETNNAFSSTFAFLPTSFKNATHLLRHLCGDHGAGYHISWPGYVKGTSKAGHVTIRIKKHTVECPIAYCVPDPGFEPLFADSAQETSKQKVRQAIRAVPFIAKWGITLCETGHDFFTKTTELQDFLASLKKEGDTA